jgi:hypothetical protein
MGYGKLSGESGSALLVTLAILGMVFLLGAMAVRNSVSESDLSFNQIHSDQSYYIAQAGARRAFSELRTDPTWTAGFSEVNFENGQYSVEVVDSSTEAALFDTLVLRATGEQDGARSTIEFWVTPGTYHPFEYAMFGKSLVDIRNSFATDSYNSDSGTYAATNLTDEGDVGSNGNIIIANGALVGGDVSSATLGGTDVHWGATVTGTVSDTAPEQDVPGVPQDQFDWAEANSAALTGISGSYTYDPVTKSIVSTGSVELSDGVYYFSDITLKNSASLTITPGASVTVYVTGDIELKNSSEMNSGGDPASLVIYSQGDFILKNSGDVAAVFYSPDGTADLRNSGEFYGSVVADDIICHNSARFHYDRTLGSIELDDVGDLAVIAYREL